MPIELNTEIFDDDFVDDDDDSMDDSKIWDEYTKDINPIKKSNNYPLGPIKKEYKRTPEKSALQPDRYDSDITSKAYHEGSLNREIIIKSLRGKKKKQLKINRTIDLHGHTLDQAYKELYNFLSICFENEERIILVITGKGNSNKDLSNNDFNHTQETKGRGVIRENFIKWIDMPSFKQIITEVFYAPPEIGGAGAFIVKLRRK